MNFHLICPYCKSKFVKKKEYVSWRDEECFEFNCPTCKRKFNLLLEAEWAEMHDGIAITLVLILLWPSAIVYKVLLINDMCSFIPILVLAILWGVVAVRSLLLKLMQVMHNNFCTKWTDKKNILPHIKKLLSMANLLMVVFLFPFLLFWGIGR